MRYTVKAAGGYRFSLACDFSILFRGCWVSVLSELAIFDTLALLRGIDVIEFELFRYLNGIGFAVLVLIRYSPATAEYRIEQFLLCSIRWAVCGGS